MYKMGLKIICKSTSTKNAFVMVNAVDILIRVDNLSYVTLALSKHENTRDCLTLKLKLISPLGKYLLSHPHQ